MFGNTFESVTLITASLSWISDKLILSSLSSNGISSSKTAPVPFVRYPNAIVELPPVPTSLLYPIGFFPSKKVSEVA